MSDETTLRPGFSRYTPEITAFALGVNAAAGDHPKGCVCALCESVELMRASLKGEP